MDSLFFALIYHWLTKRIATFGLAAAGNLTGQVTSFALILVTLWVFMRGYRMVTGPSHEPMMATVAQMIKISLIVFAAKTVSLTGSDLYTFLNTTLPQEINQIVTGSSGSLATQIDQNLLKLSAAMSAIVMVQVPTGAPALAADKAQAALLATLGIAAPAITAGAMLLLYLIAMAMLLGFAPLFILCLVFDATKDLFRRWLMFLIGTLFSMAMLNLVSAWALDLTLRVAGALWATDALARMTGVTAQGLSTAAFQQGGVGLLMTVLIISAPPLAAALFNGAMGNFMPFPAVNGGARARRSRHGGGWAGSGPSHALPYASHAPHASHTLHASHASHASHAPASHARVPVGTGHRLAGPHPVAAARDEIKRHVAPRHAERATAARDGTAQAAAPAPQAGSTGHRPLPNTGHAYLDELLGDAAYLANQNHQAQLNMARQHQDGRPLNNTEVEQAWGSVMQKLPEAMRQIANDTSLSFQQRYELSARLPGDVGLYFDRWHLAYQGDDARATEHIQDLITQIQAYQRQFGLFDPAQSTLIASDAEEAGRLLGQLLGGDHSATWLNPLEGKQGMRSTGPLSLGGETDRMGYETIGTILISDPRYFQAALAAYGLHVQEQAGGFDTDTLDATRELPEGMPTSPRGARGYAVAQGVLDAASFITDVRSKAANFRATGSITIFEHEGKKYMEYVENSYSSRLSQFRKTAPTQDMDGFKKVVKGMQHAK
jgi:type IV secretion system protein VirB6